MASYLFWNLCLRFSKCVFKVFTLILLRPFEEESPIVIASSHSCVQNVKPWSVKGIHSFTPFIQILLFEMIKKGE